MRLPAKRSWRLVLTAATVITLGSTVARAGARLLDQQGRCYATATGTFVRVA